MNVAGSTAPTEPRRTAPVGVALSAITGMRKSLAGLAALIFVMRDETTLLWIGIAAVLALIIGNVAVAGLKWRRLTFTVGADELRVESGVLSRASRSLPYARIHDLNLEQGPLARVFGLAKVTFDTGASGEEDVSLAFLRIQDGEDLRRVVRARKAANAELASNTVEAATEEPSTALFVMGPRRVFTFGLFEFSLAAIAVLFGVTQQFELLLPFDIWDWRGWQHRLAEEVAWLAGLGRTLQVVGALIAIASLLVVGFATGVTRTVLREWGFRLERTDRGFRRRRGLLTRTDVIMPVHRVQAMRLDTRIVRRWFGWNGLTFLSLAQDAGAKSHVVAPFGKREELWPIAQEAGFEAPGNATEWLRASARYRRDGIVLAGLLPFAASVILTAVGYPFLALVPLGVGSFLVAERWFAWRHTEHALDRHQVLARRGWLAPRLAIAPRMKLHSLEFRQGPLGRLHGYGTVHLGVAGGTMSIPGVTVSDLTGMRHAILDSIAQMDFCELDRPSPECGSRYAHAPSRDVGGGSSSG